MASKQNVGIIELEGGIYAEFLPEHLKDLEKSGITLDTAVSAGLLSVSPTGVRRFLGSKYPKVKSALVFPYGNTGFSRLKVFPAYEDEKKHKVKYLQAPNSGVHLYIPSIINEKISDIQVPLYFTEGEKKALKAAKEGYCCVGLGGIWNWKVTGKDEPIDEIRALLLKDRKVFLVPDSDFQTNENVRLAIKRLGEALVELGAKVEVVYLSSRNMNEKVGFDDYLVAHSPKEFDLLPRIDLNNEVFEDDPEEDDAPLPAKLSACFTGLVDLVEQEGKVAFLIKGADGKPDVSSELKTENVLLIPPSRDQIPWLLPSAEEILKHHDVALEREDLATDEKLFNDLVEYHKTISELPSESHYLLLAAFDLHTYLLESFEYSPMLCFYAVPERGKSRTGKGIAYVVYRGLHVESLREAYIIRYSDNFQGTIFFDVRDMWAKTEKAGSDDILLIRFEKGGRVARVINPEKGAFEDMKYYQVFGPTVIATNEELDHILETRCISITMPVTNKRFNTDVKPKIGLPLKERLIEFRLRHMGKPLPEIEKRFDGRFGDITRPLIQMVRLAAPSKEQEFMGLLHQLEGGRKLERAEGLEAQIIKVVTRLEWKVVKGFLPVTEIMELLNEGKPERFRYSPQRIGRLLGALGFHKGKTSEGNSAISFDKDLLERLKPQYGVTETPVMPESPEIPERQETPPGNTGVTEVTGDLDEKCGPDCPHEVKGPKPGCRLSGMRGCRYE